MNTTKKTISKKVVTLALILALAVSGVVATNTSAFAADITDSGDTKVTIRAVNDTDTSTSSDLELSWEAPVVIPFVAKADGNLITPDADTAQIKNLSAFPIKVSSIGFTPTTPWNVVTDADTASATQSDVIQFNINGIAASDTLTPKDVSSVAAWTMAAKDNTGANIGVATDGKMLRSTQSLLEAKDVGNINWTVSIA